MHCSRSDVTDAGCGSLQTVKPNMRSTTSSQTSTGIFSDLSVLNSIKQAAITEWFEEEPKSTLGLRELNWPCSPRNWYQWTEESQVKFWSRITEQVQYAWWHPTWWSRCYCRYHNKGHTWNSSPSSRPRPGSKARQAINQDENALGEEKSDEER